MIVEYMLEQVGRGDAKRAPSWIRDGGHYHDPSDFTYLGWVPNLAEREWYLPDSVTEITRTSIVTRQLTIHAAAPMQKEDSEGNLVNMTDAEVTTEVETWWDEMTNAHANAPASATIEADTEENTLSVTVKMKKKGVIVTGTPQLSVDVDGSSVTLSKTATSWNGILFSATHSMSGGETITVAASSSIDLNGGTITDGKDDITTSLSGFSEDVTATA